MPRTRSCVTFVSNTINMHAVPTFNRQSNILASDDPWKPYTIIYKIEFYASRTHNNYFSLSFIAITEPEWIQFFHPILLPLPYLDCVISLSLSRSACVCKSVVAESNAICIRGNNFHVENIVVIFRVFIIFMCAFAGTIK